MKAGSFYQNYREVTLLVVHCSATRCDRHFSVEALRRSHLARGFADIGYHFYITRDGEVHICRPVHQIGAHATGWNDKSIGICYEGGLNENAVPMRARPMPAGVWCLCRKCQKRLKKRFKELPVIFIIIGIFIPIYIKNKPSNTFRPSRPFARSLTLM